MQWPARRLLIFGLHVHVGVLDGDTAIAVVGHLENWLPHLLALTASSPFWEGRDTGLASSRIKVFENLPTAGLPHRHWKGFEQLIDALIRSGAIESSREVWWDIRPHPSFGTVEVRVCDAIPTLTESVAVAALIQALIVYLQRQIKRGEPMTDLHERIVTENKWRAARWSTKGSTIVDELGNVKPIASTIQELLTDLQPIFDELKSQNEIGHLERILRDGPSYERQRAVFKSSGGDLKKVVDSLIQESERDEPVNLSFATT